MSGDSWDAAVMTPRDSGGSRAWVDAYLTRLGLDRVEVHLAGHRGGMLALAEAHARLVPYENLAVLRGDGVQCTVEGVVDKIVRRRHGGIGLEVNGGLAALLDALGYDVELRGAAVAAEDGRYGPPLMHAVIVARIPDPWIVDVGFNAEAFALPVGGSDDAQAYGASADVAREVQAAGGGLPDPSADLDVTINGAPIYCVEARPRRLEDFVAPAWWYGTSPDSPHRKSPLCSRATSQGRVTLADRRFIHLAGGRISERLIEDDADLVATYQRRFGLQLAEVPQPGITG